MDHFRYFFLTFYHSLISLAKICIKWMAFTANLSCNIQWSILTVTDPSMFNISQLLLKIKSFESDIVECSSTINTTQHMFSVIFKFDFWVFYWLIFQLTPHSDWRCCDGWWKHQENQDISCRCVICL